MRFFLGRLTALIGFLIVGIAFKIHGEATAITLAEFFVMLDNEVDGNLAATLREAAR